MDRNIAPPAQTAKREPFFTLAFKLRAAYCVAATAYGLKKLAVWTVGTVGALVIGLCLALTVGRHFGNPNAETPESRIRILDIPAHATEAPPASNQPARLRLPPRQ